MKKTTLELNFSKLLPAILLPLITGVTSSFFSMEGMLLYNDMPKPPLSPPAFVFPIAWTLLYLMMGVASYLVWNSTAETKTKQTALLLYLIQLGMNFCWSIIFFSLGMYMFAFVWLMIMYIFIIICTAHFFSISRTAGWLMIPYIFWMGFAAYLNLGVN